MTAIGVRAMAGFVRLRVKACDREILRAAAMSNRMTTATAVDEAEATDVARFKTQLSEIDGIIAQLDRAARRITVLARASVLAEVMQSAVADVNDRLSTVIWHELDDTVIEEVHDATATLGRLGDSLAGVWRGGRR